MAKQRTEEQQDRYSRFGSPIQWGIALAAGTVSAAYTFRNLVFSKYMSDGEHRQGFSVLIKAKGRDLADLADKHIESTIERFTPQIKEHEKYAAFKKARNTVNGHGGTPTGEASLAYSNTYSELLEVCKPEFNKIADTAAFKKAANDHIKELHECKIKHNKRFKDYGKYMFGLETEGFASETTGLIQRFKGFADSRRPIILKTALAFGGAAGVGMMLFNQLNTREKLNEIDKQSENADRKADALIAKQGIDEHEIETRQEHRAHIKESEKLQKLADKKGGHAAKIQQSRAEAELSDEPMRA